MPPEKIINQEEKLTVVSSREQILARIASLKEGSIEKRKAEQEFSKLMICNERNSDYFESYDYLIHLLNMPWTKTDTLELDLNVSEQILNNSHWGLGKVKERILEFLAVVQQSDAAKTPILCLAGAPGVGKTSLGESIAKAVGRKFIKFSLGGVYDSATVKGHMRTYRGSTPGLIMQSIQQAGSKNPVMLLDEIDKMGGSVRLKDVESTLLELLDPKQNQNFTDHFLAIPFDLSQIMFITTANNIEDISAPLRDRLEIINIDSYTPNEKLQIAKVHIIPQIIANYKMDKDKIIFTDESIQAIINLYTMEAGVRNLERSVETILRKILKASLTGSARPVKITPKTLIKYLGAAPFNNVVETGNHIGRILVLSSGSQGGNIVHIEAVKAQGSGKIQYTGNLGAVLKESVETAYSCFKSQASKLAIEYEEYKKYDIHVHLSSAATPKEGPSAGVAIYLAIVSALLERKIKGALAITGELGLTGKIMKIGGLKEKILAAQRFKLDTVLIPEDNLQDLAEIPNEVLSSLKIIGINHVDQLLRIALESRR